MYTAILVIIDVFLIIIGLQLYNINSTLGTIVGVSGFVSPIIIDSIVRYYSEKEKQQKLKRQAAIASAAAIDTNLLYPQRIGPIKPQNSNSLLEQISKLSGVSEFELVKSVEEYNNHEKQSTDAS